MKKLRLFSIYVTHDQAEASAVADRIALVDKGRIIQLERPEYFYRKPANLYVARFFGWQNFISAKKNGREICCALGRFRCGNMALPDGNVILCIRAEAACNIGDGRIKGSVCAVSICGIDMMFTVECGAVNIRIVMRARSDIGVGTELSFDLNEEYIWPVSDGEV